MACSSEMLVSNSGTTARLLTRIFGALMLKRLRHRTPIEFLPVRGSQLNPGLDSTVPDCRNVLNAGAIFLLWLWLDLQK